MYHLFLKNSLNMLILACNGFQLILCFSRNIRNVQNKLRNAGFRYIIL
ncbi:hypothetical protein HMPREF3213_01077 [Heyndrickxia coagulans]|uniref:Uncharacterized protein n=1 Tax=Heyndrickxia coagulans TaxID=1398 RepID=A0A133KWN1_HEYCO|nr:hypothetical protein HMPREF3213_01077 [Heyndrickxia coagulans]